MGRSQGGAATWAAVTLAVVLAGCGGGGGGEAGSSAPPPPSTGTAPPSPTGAKISGVVFSGAVRNTDVRFYDATKYVVGGTNAVLASTTTDSTGAYSTTLPPNFASPLLIKAQGKADRSSSIQDPVFGAVALSSAFELDSVVPASAVRSASSVTANVTAFTNAMAALVNRKLGQADIDSAIEQARIQVEQRLTSGINPVTGETSSPKAAVMAGAVSNIGRAARSTALSDPYNCAAEAATEAKLICAVKTSSAILQPFAVDADTKIAPAINYNHAAALQTAASNVDLSAVASNTGLGIAALTTAKEEVVQQVTAVKAAAGSESSLSTLQKIWLAPNVVGTEGIGGSISFSSGPHAGKSYAARTFGFSWCISSECTGIGPVVTLSAEDQMEDPNAHEEARAAHGELHKRFRELLSSLAKADKSPSRDAFEQALKAGIKAGLSAESVDTALSAVTASLAGAGYSVPAGSGSAPLSTPEQIAAAQSCTDASEYQNPTATPFDPQLDSNCRIAQFDACLRRKTGLTTFDKEGRAACSIVSDMIRNLTGTWRCNYCPYPY